MVVLLVHCCKAVGHEISIFGGQGVSGKSLARPVGASVLHVRGDRSRGCYASTRLGGDDGVVIWRSRGRIWFCLRC